MNRLFHWLKKQYQREGEPGYWLKIISIVIPLFLSVYAIYLTIRIERSDTKAESLRLLVESNKTIHEDNKSMIDSLSKQNYILNEQLEFLRYSQNILLDNYKVTKQSLYANKIEDWRKYKILKSKISDRFLTLLFRDDTTFLNYDVFKRKEILFSLQPDLEDVIHNKVVILNSELNREWNEFYKSYNDFTLLNLKYDDMGTYGAKSKLSESFIQIKEKFYNHMNYILTSSYDKEVKVE